MPDEERLARLETRLETLFGQFDKRMADRFLALNTRIDDMQARFNDLQGGVGDLSHRVGSLEATMNQRLATLEATMNQRFTAMENRLTSMENRFTSLEGRLDHKASNWLVSFWAAGVTTVIGAATAIIKLWP
jgi:chromosome segregation ATPase